MRVTETHYMGENKNSYFCSFLALNLIINNIYQDGIIRFVNFFINHKDLTPKSLSSGHTSEDRQKKYKKMNRNQENCKTFK